MCLSRFQWSCQHGVAYDSLRQNGTFAPSSVFSVFAPDGHNFRWFHYCPPCVAAADQIRSAMVAWAEAETDRCAA